MITRDTVWTDSNGNVRQVEIAILNAVWEPLWARFQPLGPFDDPLAARQALLEEGRAWYNLHGEQLDLGC